MKLKGNRTYIVAILVAVVTAAHQLGKIDTTLYTTLLGLLGAGGLATLRAAKPTSHT